MIDLAILALGIARAHAEGLAALLRDAEHRLRMARYPRRKGEPWSI